MAKLFVAASSQYLTVNSAPVTAAPFSVSCWFRPATIAAAHTLIGIGDIDVANENWRLTVNAIGRARWSAQTSVGEVFVTYTTTVFSAGAWGHIGGVEASATSRAVYFNGGSASNSTSRAPAGADTTRIGLNARSGAADYADGDIAEVGIWNIDLTAAEMALLAAGYSPLFVRPESLVFYMPLVRNDVELIGGLALTAVNSPTVSDHPRVLLPSRPYYSLPAAGGGAYTLDLDAGSYAITGRDPTLTADRALSLDAGSYVITGQDVTLAVSRVLDLDAGSYTVTGNDATLAADRALSLDAGSYAITGQDATLEYSGSTYTLNLDAGNYVITGHDVALTVGRTLDLDAGSYVVTGQDASLLHGFALDLDAGIYTITGQDAGLLATRVLGLDAGIYTISGQSTTLAYSGVVEGSVVVLADGALYGVELADSALYAVAVEDSAYYVVASSDATI